MAKVHVSLLETYLRLTKARVVNILLISKDAKTAFLRFFGILNRFESRLKNFG